MGRTVKGYCASCERCRRRKAETRSLSGPLQSMFSTRPFQVLSIDFSGPYNETTRGNKYLLSLVCHFSGYTQTFPTSSMEVGVVAEVLINFFSIFGVAESILSDRGRSFECQLMFLLCEFFGIKKIGKGLQFPATMELSVNACPFCL